jgi:divalent metal cation (Fe/Co/Zn/Cd) transporter
MMSQKRLFVYVVSLGVAIGLVGGTESNALPSFVRMAGIITALLLAWAAVQRYDQKISQFLDQVAKSL